MDEASLLMSNESRVVSNPRWFLSITGAILCAFLIGCSETVVANKNQANASAAVPEKKRVSVVEARRTRLTNELAITAEFLPYQEVDVMAKVSGYLKKINVDVGDRVRTGQLLAVVEVPEMIDDLTRNEASIERSQAELARARNEVERTQTAHEMMHLSFTRIAGVQKSRPGLIAQQEIDTARNRDLLAESQVLAAKSSLTAAEQALKVQQADGNRVKTLYSYTNVTAPFDGIVNKRYVATGAMIQAGTSSHTQAMPVVRIAQTHLLRLVLPAPESVVPRLRTGMAVEVRVPTLDRTFQGRMARLSGRISPATRTMESEVDVSNPNDTLVPGMFAEAIIRLEDHGAALAIPPSAIETEGQKRSVYVVNAQNRIERRSVQTGLETPEQVEILQGLQEGDLVMMGSRGSVREGQVVEPVRSGEKKGA